jgi:hypothetical protein
MIQSTSGVGQHIHRVSGKPALSPPDQFITHQSHYGFRVIDRSHPSKMHLPYVLNWDSKMHLVRMRCWWNLHFHELNTSEHIPSMKTSTYNCRVSSKRVRSCRIRGVILPIMRLSKRPRQTARSPPPRCRSKWRARLGLQSRFRHCLGRRRY